MGKSLRCLRNEMKASMDGAGSAGMSTVDNWPGEIGRHQAVQSLLGHIKLQAGESC